MLIDTLLVSSMPRKDLEALVIAAAKLMQADEAAADAGEWNPVRTVELLAPLFHSAGVLYVKPSKNVPLYNQDRLGE